jgi:hypothetical protein
VGSVIGTHTSMPAGCDLQEAFQPRLRPGPLF